MPIGISVTPSRQRLRRTGASSSPCRRRSDSARRLQVVGVASPICGDGRDATTSTVAPLATRSAAVGFGPQEFGNLRRHQTKLMSSHAPEAAAVETRPGRRSPGILATPMASREIDGRSHRECVETLPEARGKTLSPFEPTPYGVAVAENGCDPGDMRTDVTRECLPACAACVSLRDVRRHHGATSVVAENPCGVHGSGLRLPLRRRSTRPPGTSRDAMSADGTVPSRYPRIDAVRRRMMRIESEIES